MPKLFPVVPRGFDQAQVDALFAQVDAAVAGGDADARAAAREALTSTVFEFRDRGYAPTDVSMAVDQRLTALS